MLLPLALLVGVMLATVGFIWFFTSMRSLPGATVLTGVLATVILTITAMELHVTLTLGITPETAIWVMALITMSTFLTFLGYILRTDRFSDSALTVVHDMEQRRPNPEVWITK